MTQLNVKIRKVRPHAVVPTYGTAGAACFDLYAAEDVIIAPGDTAAVPVGFAVELPDGYEMQIRPRSGISLKTKLRVANSPGCVDSDFRGEVAVIFDNIFETLYEKDGTPAFTDVVATLDGKNDDITFAKTHAFVSGTVHIRRGERIAQAAVVPIPRVSFVEVDEELTQTERGAGGFGHTGVN